MEAHVLPVTGTELVHKVFHPQWITQHYPMDGKLKVISVLGLNPLGKRNVQPPKYPDGLSKVSPLQWENITFILSHHSADVFKQARSLKIPTPSSVKPVKLQGTEGSYWVLEMNNLKKEGHSLLDGKEFLKHYNRKSLIINHEQLYNQITESEKKLKEKNIYYDENHKPFGGWIIRINNKTNRGELFLVDVSNYRIGR
jgi:hypothetical protein